MLLHAAVRRDGQVVAIDSRSWLVHRRELGAAYRNELALELTTLGFGVVRGTGRGGRYFEIEGVPAVLIDRWSSRHHQVRAVIDERLDRQRVALQATIAAGGADAEAAAVRLERLERSGQLAPRQDRAIGAFTRDQKRLVTRADLDREWTHTAGRIGFTARDLDRLRGHERSLVPAGDGVLLERLTEFRATFADREARAVALEASAGVGIDQALTGLARLREEGQLLALADGRSTTAAHRRAEHATVKIAANLATSRSTAIPARLAERETMLLAAELERVGGKLTAEQRTAIAVACSERQLVMIEGHAGTGKSTTLTAIARAHQADSRAVIVTSTAALAAERLANELQAAGVNAAGYSTQALHAATFIRTADTRRGHDRDP